MYAGVKEKVGFAKRGSQVETYSLKMRVLSRLSHKYKRDNMCFASSLRKLCFREH